MYSVNKTKNINSLKRFIYFRVIIANFKYSNERIQLSKHYVLLYLKKFINHFSLYCSVKDQHSGNAEIFIITFILKQFQLGDYF